MSRRPILRVGRRTFPLGTGVRRGWMDAEDFFDKVKGYSVNDLPWKEPKYRCNDCNEDLKMAMVPCGFHFVVYICANGHKFCYENTD